MTLNEWRLKRSYSYRKLAKILGAGGATTIRRWCLPKEHPQSLVPSQKYMTMIVDISNGEVMPNDFYITR
tara:strand:+ start:277 stop:486 length:210 start_codon:yes stop_codon:yes gene_type:complete